MNPPARYYSFIEKMTDPQWISIIYLSKCYSETKSQMAGFVVEEEDLALFLLDFAICLSRGLRFGFSSKYKDLRNLQRQHRENMADRVPI